MGKSIYLLIIGLPVYISFQAICELFKRSLQTLMDDFAPLSKSIAELLVQMYQTIPHVSILDLTKQVKTYYVKQVHVMYSLSYRCFPVDNVV